MTTVKNILFRLVLCMCLALAGCGPAEKTDSKGYYGVGWTSDQKIIAAYRHSQIEGNDNSKNVFAYHWLSEIDPQTLSEEKLIDIPWSDGPGYFLGNKGSFFGYIGATLRLDGYVLKRFSLPNQTSEIDVGVGLVPAPYSVSPSLELISLNKTDRFQIYDANLNLIKEKTSAICAIFKSDSELFFYDTSMDKLALYNIASETALFFLHSFKPEFFNPQQNTLFRIEDGILFQYNLSTETITSRNLLYDSSKLRAHYFSPDGKKLLLSKTQGFYLPDKNLALQSSLGIYLYDLETDELTKVRD